MSLPVGYLRPEGRLRPISSSPIPLAIAQALVSSNSGVPPSCFLWSVTRGRRRDVVAVAHSSSLGQNYCHFARNVIAVEPSRTRRPLYFRTDRWVLLETKKKGNQFEIVLCEIKLVQARLKRTTSFQFVQSYHAANARHPRADNRACSGGRGSLCVDSRNE